MSTSMDTGATGEEIFIVCLWFCVFYLNVPNSQKRNVLNSYTCTKRITWNSITEKREALISQIAETTPRGSHTYMALMYKLDLKGSDGFRHESRRTPVFLLAKIQPETRLVRQYTFATDTYPKPIWNHVNIYLLQAHSTNERSHG